MGKFYKIKDNRCGHPGRIFYAQPESNIYYIVRFSTKPRKDRIKLKHSLNPSHDNPQYVVKKAIQKSYDDMEYKKEYSFFRVHPEDEKIVKDIENKYLNQIKK